MHHVSCTCIDVRTQITTKPWSNQSEYFLAFPYDTTTIAPKSPNAYELFTDMGWLVIALNRMSAPFQSSVLKKLVICVCPDANSPATTADPAPPTPPVEVVCFSISVYASR